MRNALETKDEVSGQIRLRMTVGSAKDKNVASQEFRHVLYLLLIYDLDTSGVLRYGWDGRFSKSESETILGRLQRQGGLLESDVDLAKWLVYTQVQSKFPLDTRIFAPLFLVLVEHLKQGVFDEVDVGDFQRFYKKNVHFCNNYTPTFRLNGFGMPPKDWLRLLHNLFKRFTRF